MTVAITGVVAMVISVACFIYAQNIGEQDD